MNFDYHKPSSAAEVEKLISGGGSVIIGAIGSPPATPCRVWEAMQQAGGA